MLFHITHVHSAESCPYHDTETVAKTYGKALLGFEEAGVTQHGAYVDAPAHTIYLIDPIIDAGSAEIRPIRDAVATARERMSSDQFALKL